MKMQPTTLVTSSSCILAINGGSSSIKFSLFALDQPLLRILTGSITGVGLAHGSFDLKGANLCDNFSQPVVLPDHVVAVGLLMDWVRQRIELGALTAVGHRVVHGGPKYWKSQQITLEMIEELRQLDSFDPEHLPEEILLIEAFGREFPDIPQIVCFDTAFHHDMPRVAQLLPIPRRYQANGFRRYGFHGLSYTYLMQEFERLAGVKSAQGRIILAHLGNGASMAAVHLGSCLDTTMAFTPAAGLVMGTRSGDIDPGLVSYMCRSELMTAAQFDKMINHESGLLGVSETSSDMRDLLAHEIQDVRAAEAVELFCYRAKKQIGAYAVTLGGLDTLVFAGGIGENASSIRLRISQGLEFLGIKLDESRNNGHLDRISSDASRVSVRVIRTDEELMIARLVCQVLGLNV